jgi:thioredoxin
VPLELDSHGLSSILTATKVPVLIDFWAPWCGPCKTLLPHLSVIEAEYGARLTIVKVDIDRSPDVLAECRIQSVPTLVLWVPGKMEVARRVGAASLLHLREFIGPCLATFQTESGQP